MSSNTTTGGNRGGGSSSLSTLITVLIPTGLVALGWVAFFLYFRTRQRRIYEPRTYLGRFSESERAPTPSRSMFGWVKDFMSVPDEFVLQHQSLDGYLWLRYLKMITLISFVGCIITWPVLFPVYATGGNTAAQAQELNVLTFTKVVNPNRFYATAFISWIFFGFVLYIIGRESLHYVAIRQAYFTSPLYASRISSRTVCFTDVPEQYLNEERVREMFFGVKHVWLATDCTDLEKLIKERDKTAMKLESAEVALSRNANTRRLKAEKKRAKGKQAESLEGVAWVNEKKRPTHKLGLLGCCGEKVDTITWSREHLQEVIPMVEQEQEAHWNGKSKYLSACFVEFETVGHAQAAFQQSISHLPKRFQPRCIGVRPQEIVWTNLNKNWFRRDILKMASIAIVVVAIIFWSIPVSFAGFLSNVQSLFHFSWLHWLSKIPSQITGIVTGLIPVVYLAVLMALVPIFCRLLAKFAGAISIPEIELTTQNYYFAFQVVNVFLITTFASGASGILSTVLSQPSKAPMLLAQNLPTASNFYISYFILYGLAFAGSALAQASALALFYVLGYVLDKTPRKKFARYSGIGGIAWGSAYPPMSLLGVIILAYSTIAPLILGFAAIGMYLIYLANRYAVIYCLDTTNISTQGQAYGRAIQHLMVGVYLAEVCLIGLLAIFAGNAPAAVGPMILMIIFLVFTIFYHSYIRKMIRPLARTLPRDLLANSTGGKFDASHSDKTGVNAGARNASTATYPSSDDDTVNGTNGDLKASTTGASNHAVHTGGLINQKPPRSSMFSVKSWLFWLRHPNHVPELPGYFYSSGPEYSVDQRREAYLDPAITSPTPSLWIVQDSMGISEREKADTGKVLGITDNGAWFDDKGKLQTVVTSSEGMLDPNSVEKAPVYEPTIPY